MKNNNETDTVSDEEPFPGNMGRMNDPDGSAFIKGLCGDTMEMYLVIKNNRITEVLYTTDGCGSSKACGSAAAKLAGGKSIREALRISPAEVLDALANEPTLEIHCAILAVMTLHKAIADYLLRFEKT
ncbi:MAG: iron-sulfur cluster assembly scaffold protein [Spirochaetes bacterium]|jgi:nitrogen fixation NifU-like protein|nr:iron-sulfur cluster assembly scaffold protein [Spirochaetota bacterium]